MTSARLFVAVAALLSPGCLVALDSQEASPYAWKIRREPSMLPHFPGSDVETYPMVVIHKHVGESALEEEEYRTGKRARVVCFTLDGLEAAPAMDSGADYAADMACVRVYDPGTGRLFVSREEFAQWDPWAVAVIGAGCGVTHPIQAIAPGLQVDAPGHRFRMEFLHNDTLRVDGWYVEPGTSLKIDYMDAGPDAARRDDDRPVTLVFDYPGRWLRSRVGPVEENERWTPRPTEGDGPEAWINRTPTGLAEILRPLQAETPHHPTQLAELRVTLVGGNVTDVSVVFAGERFVRWFVAGGDDKRVRMLAATVNERPASRMPLTEFRAAFDGLPFSAMHDPHRAGDTLDVRWSPERGLRSGMPVPWSETWVPPSRECGDACRFVWAADASGADSWRRADAAQEVKSDDATSLTIRSDGASGARERLYFRPA